MWRRTFSGIHVKMSEMSKSTWSDFQILWLFALGFTSPLVETIQDLQILWSELFRIRKLSGSTVIIWDLQILCLDDMKHMLKIAGVHKSSGCNALWWLRAVRFSIGTFQVAFEFSFLQLLGFIRKHLWWTPQGVLRRGSWVLGSNRVFRTLWT